MINKERLKHCRLFKGEKEHVEYDNFYLRYACYAEIFYCRANALQDSEGHKELVWYNVDTTPYKDIPYPLLCHLFSVWVNKLAGSSQPNVVVPAFHNRFMRVYLNADRIKHCRYFNGINEPDMEYGFDEYYFAMVEKNYAYDRNIEEEQYFINLVKDLHLDDLASEEVPIELVALLFGSCDHVAQRGSLEPCPREHVAKNFRKKFFPKYLNRQQ